ncbi:flagellar protein FliT [Microbulbifer magnicolonia]|uniref:flagellar protein FliT n=1 Tax=Microbulbifer magnicolonia TaxID=3109744 RepID=UPI002B4180B3|nr:flagellar protein FliT [Microbulbifer sp. GG15]
MKRPNDQTRLNSPEWLLAAYAKLLQRTSRMLACVDEKDWFTLVEEQSCYVIEVEFLSRAEANLALSGAQKERKAALLEQIIEQVMEIRSSLLARREELRRQIDVSQRKRDLVRSYGVPPLLDNKSP